MLHTNTVEPGTLGLLTQIMALPQLESFNLAGGTALALQIGHRKSYDLDFFGNRPFEYGEIEELVAPLGSIKPIQQSKNILILKVNDVKVDFVNYRYQLLGEVNRTDGLRLLSLMDIGAMKLAAITGRGRKRDFTDLFFLMKHFSLKELVGFYNQKYPDGNELLVARSLAYFTDAEEDEDLTLLQEADWPTVKKAIETAVKQIYR
ncbi:MAG: hypothetical protein DYG98_10295 [Haliscomenobacteraceae bacterium CHB4]|nr:hypothetical protein [Haliscomenobacteraceae bacterium CHB4]